VVNKLVGRIATGKRLNVHKMLLAANPFAWARIQGGASSIVVPGNGEATVVLELGGARLVDGDYGATLRLTTGSLLRTIPITLALHNYSVVPESGAVACNFGDQDIRPGFVHGALTVTRAADETMLSQYRLYWANSAGQVLTSLPQLASLDSGNTFRDDFLNFDPAFWQAPASGSGWALGVGYVRFKGTYDAAHLTFVRQLTPPFTIKAKVRTVAAFVSMVIQVGGSDRKLFRSSGGIQAMFVGNYKALQAPGGTRTTAPCIRRTWYEVTVSVQVDSVTFSDDQSCLALTVPHTLGGMNPQSIVIGAECTGTCAGSDWDFVEIDGAQAVYNVPEGTVIPEGARNFAVHAWNPVGQQLVGPVCSLADNIGAQRAVAPTNVVASLPTINSASVSWICNGMNHCQFNAYSVKIRSSESANWTVPVGCSGLVDRMVTTCVASNLTSNSPYHVKVSVLCENPEANSLESEATVALLTLPKPALAPTRVSTILPTTSSMVVSWETERLFDCEILTSIVEGTTTSGEPSWFQPANCTSMSWDQRSCLAGDLAPGVQYEFRVHTSCLVPTANSEYSITSDPMSTVSSSTGEL
jgi:hypothetical protein